MKKASEKWMKSSFKKDEKTSALTEPLQDASFGTSNLIPDDASLATVKVHQMIIFHSFIRFVFLESLTFIKNHLYGYDFSRAPINKHQKKPFKTNLSKKLTFQ